MQHSKFKNRTSPINNQRKEHAQYNHKSRYLFHKTTHIQLPKWMVPFNNWIPSSRRSFKQTKTFIATLQPDLSEVKLTIMWYLIKTYFSYHKIMKMNYDREIFFRLIPLKLFSWMYHHKKWIAEAVSYRTKRTGTDNRYSVIRIWPILQDMSFLYSFETRYSDYKELSCVARHET